MKIHIVTHVHRLCKWDNLFTIINITVPDTRTRFAFAFVGGLEQPAPGAEPRLGTGPLRQGEGGVRRHGEVRRQRGLCGRRQALVRRRAGPPRRAARRHRAGRQVLDEMRN